MIHKQERGEGYHIWHKDTSPNTSTRILTWLLYITVPDEGGETEFLNQVQYDIFVVDDEDIRTRSIAQEEGRQFLYSPSGQALIDFVVKEDPGTANYVIWIYGLAPNGIVPSGPSDYLQIEIPIYASDGSTPVEKIPSWIKNNAGWWADGTIDDAAFVQGIQFLIKEGILRVQ